jgi:hypothetical protein
MGIGREKGERGGRVIFDEFGVRVIMPGRLSDDC